MFVIGITGGIGSGKTAATNHFQQLGITVVDADVIARQVVEPNSIALSAIQKHFGDSVIEADGTLNRRALRNIVFDVPAERQWLEQLTHPLIAKEIKLQLSKSQSPYTLLSSPLLLESTQHQLTQRILVIDAPEALQLERTIHRDEATKESVQAIIDIQMNREDRLKHADDIIYNDQGLDHLYRQVDALHAHFIDMAKQQH